MLQEQAGKNAKDISLIFSEVRQMVDVKEK